VDATKKRFMVQLDARMVVCFLSTVQLKNLQNKKSTQNKLHECKSETKVFIIFQITDQLPNTTFSFAYVFIMKVIVIRKSQCGWSETLTL